MFLLDTNILIWSFSREKALSQKTRTILKDKDYVIYVSVASVWEIELKRKKKFLDVPGNVLESILEAGFEILNISSAHVIGSCKLPDIHSDPFDRLLIAQALEENLQLITSDKIMKKYDVDIIFEDLRSKFN